MADNVTLNAGSGGATLAADDISGVHHQRVKISIGADGSATDLSSSNPMPAAGDVAHDASDSGNPVKVGGKAATALPTAVASGDRTNLLTDVYGRPLIAHVDFGMQIWKSYNTTSQATGAAIWTPSSGKKIVVTHYVLSIYGTTAGRVILWFGAGGGSPDTTYTEGTDQPLAKASFAPSATVKTGLAPALPHPIACATADYVLRITSDAAMSIDGVFYGYEI